jgi:hypothetical protein
MSIDEERRGMLRVLSAAAGAAAIAATTHPAAEKDTSGLPPPKLALTGRDEHGVATPSTFQGQREEGR